MKIWTQAEEAENLQRLFNQHGVKRTAFARDYKVPGGASMIYQHINGLRPISLSAAHAYATGFKVSLAEVSPRLAEEVMRAQSLDGNTGYMSVKIGHSTVVDQVPVSNTLTLSALLSEIKGRPQEDLIEILKTVTKEIAKNKDQ